LDNTEREKGVGEFLICWFREKERAKRGVVTVEG